MEIKLTRTNCFDEARTSKLTILINKRLSGGKDKCQIRPVSFLPFLGQSSNQMHSSFDTFLKRLGHPYFWGRCPDIRQAFKHVLVCNYSFQKSTNEQKRLCCKKNPFFNICQYAVARNQIRRAMETYSRQSGDKCAGFLYLQSRIMVRVSESLAS